MKVLEALLKKPPKGASQEAKADKEWHRQFDCAMSRGRELLKREWEVTKSPLLGKNGRGREADTKEIGTLLATWLRGSLSVLGLTVAVAAAVVALVQLGDTKRAVALGSFAMIREGYSVPKTQFYAYAVENRHRLQGESAGNVAIVMRMYTQEYLRSIEFVADAYMRGNSSALWVHSVTGGLLDEEARRFVTEYVKEDIEDLLLCFYREDGGSIDLTDHIGMPWIRPDDEGWKHSGGYPATTDLAADLQVKLVSKPCFGV